MNPAGYAIRYQAVTIVLALFVAIGGILSYGNLGRLEDPEFTIKTAVITTAYPGATALEVEQEVTEKLETAVQQLKQLDEVRSLSRAGVSIIYADIQDKYDKDTLPQVWDELRRKVKEAAGELPPGALAPAVNDDFGDVYGIFFAITGDGYDMQDLEEFAKDLRRELLLCEDVGRIAFYGVQPEAVYVEIDRTRLARLGISPATIFATIRDQNTVTPAGTVKVGWEEVPFRVTGSFDDVDDLEELLVPGGLDGRMIRLKDVARVERGTVTPPAQLLHYNGQPAVGLGISTVQGGNVVTMGESVEARLAGLRSQVPVGIEIHPIAYQAETVKEAVQGFVLNLFEALAIVILLLVIFMGLREGLIIGGVLLLTILGTFIGMDLLDVSLQRISLGALIIALGMLVDNAIVVAEGIVIKIQRGVDRLTAAEETVRETQWPLLGATFIAILAFAAISVSQDVTGEFLGSLFQVIGLALLLSWIFAVTVTPYLCVRFLPEKKAGAKEPQANFFYRAYRRFLGGCIRHRFPVLAVVGALLLGALYSFQFVQQNFFPDSTRPQFLVDVRFPEGTHIDRTLEGVEEVAEYVQSLDGVTDVTTFTGSGGLRFILTYEPDMPSSAYGQLLVSVDDSAAIPELIAQTREHLEWNLPDAVTSVDPFKYGPGGSAVEARLSGPDPDVLRGLAGEVMAVMREHPNTRAIRNNWENRVKTTRIHMAESRARDIGVIRPEIGGSLQMTFSGLTAGLYRDGDELLPIILRPPREEREGIDNLDDVQVWSVSTGRSVPMEQVVDHVATEWEDPLIRRLNRKRTVTVSCKEQRGTADALFRDLRGPIEAIPLPAGYTLEWGGEYENSTEANQKLMANVPIAFALMFLISVALFNTLRHPVIIFLGLPLAIIGVTVGLLLADQPFGFMALLGFLSLSGMLIKNEVVLLDQINLERAEGKAPFQAVVDAAVSRVRPVSLAAFTTVLGMVPLLWDAFFAAMAVTIMAGLTFATVLTLVVVPVLYATFFRVPKPPRRKARKKPSETIEAEPLPSSA